MDDKILKYYSRKDIQKEIVNSARDREVGVQYKEGFGRRPDILQFEGDVYALAERGATSFHISEERWKNPLQLVSGMNKKQLDEIRTSWDLILDLDSPFLEYSKIAASLLIDALKFYNIKNIGLKFSGNRSFHLFVPCDSFPSKVNNVETRLLFPEGPSMVASYLKEMIREHLAAKILELNMPKEIARSINKKEEELISNGLFDPYKILDIDTVLISSRHLFRAPYSINEKSGLVSIPILTDELKEFKIKNAKIESVKVSEPFIKEGVEGEATQLIVQAFDWAMRYKKNDPGIEIKRKEYDLPSIAIKPDFFPPCMLKSLEGIKTDGRKRIVFVLTNFLKQVGWSIDDIKNLLYEWNKKNYEPLREGYIAAQMDWHKRQKQNLLPPNCESKGYYKDIGVCFPNNICKSIKNPVNYTFRRFKMLKESKGRKGKAKA